MPLPPGLRLQKGSAIGSFLVASQAFRTGDLLLEERPCLVGLTVAQLPSKLRQLLTTKSVDSQQALGPRLGELVAYAQATKLAKDVVYESFYCPPADLQMRAKMFKSASSCMSLMRRSGFARHEDDATWRSHMINVFYIWQVNSHAFGDASALFRYGSKFQHRCLDPHVAYVDDSARRCGRFVALRDIDEGEVVTLSYLGLQMQHLMPANLRRRKLRENYLFNC